MGTVHRQEWSLRNTILEKKSKHRSQFHINIYTYSMLLRRPLDSILLQ